MHQSMQESRPETTGVILQNLLLRHNPRIKVWVVYQLDNYIFTLSYFIDSKLKEESRKIELILTPASKTNQ